MRTLTRAALATSLAALAACSSTMPAGTGGVAAGGAGGAGTSSSSGMSSSSGVSSSSSGAASSSSGSAGASSSTSASSGSASSSSGSSTDVAQMCVDIINGYRATIGLPAYQRWTAEEACASGQAAADAAAMSPHSTFMQCTELAQNECSGYTGGDPAQVIKVCLGNMWSEGPGTGNAHGHYNNMASASFTKVACGPTVTADGHVWVVQDFR